MTDVLPANIDLNMISVQRTPSPESASLIENRVNESAGNSLTPKQVASLENTLKGRTYTMIPAPVADHALKKAKSSVENAAAPPVSRKAWI
jgi:ATP phosphoribosyltransferase